MLTGSIPVTQTFVAHTTQFRNALDHDAIGSRSADLCPHAVENIRQFAHLGLPRGVVENGFSLRQGGGHHDILGAVHRDRVEVDLRALEARAKSLNGAVVQANFRTQSLQPLQVLIDRTHADRTTSGLRDTAAAEPRHQRSEDHE